MKERYMAIKELRERDRDLDRFTLSRFMEGENLAEAE